MSAKINRDMTWGAERGAGGTVTLQEEVTQKLWRAMEEVICLSECSVYSYRPEGDMDPLSAEGKVCSHYCVFSRGGITGSLALLAVAPIDWRCVVSGSRSGPLTTSSTTKS